MDPEAAIKSIAEMTFIFYRHVVSLGADAREAIAMTSAYVEAMVFGGSRHTNESGDES